MSTPANVESPMSTQFSRRAFAGSIASAASAAAVTPSDRIRYGIVGCGNRGSYLLDCAANVPGAALVGASDLYQTALARAVGRANQVAGYGDYRRLLERKDIDAVFIATHNNWHHQVAMDALAAGKDIYLEKPMTHRLEEGAEIMASVKQYRRVAQIGHHRRSAPVYQKAREMVAAGMLGKVTMVRSQFYRNSRAAQWRYPIPADASPTTIDWDTFLRKAPRRQFDPARFFQWFCYRDYCGGIPADLLAHSMDCVHFVLGAKAPSRVTADGEILFWKDGREVPDTLTAVFRYPEGFQATFQATFANQQPGKRDEFFGKDGTIVILGERQLTFYPEPTARGQLEEIALCNEAYTTKPAAQLHIENFFECIRSRSATCCTEQDGDASAACGHLANLSLQQQRAINWDPDRRTWA